MVLGLFLNTNVLAGIKNIGNELSINIPNNFKYFELTFRQLVSRFPDISDEFIYEDFGIGMGSKLIVIANNKKTIKIIEWPNLIQTPLENKLEIYIDYKENENERNMIVKGLGKWENIKNEV